jgi:hypothetical protein
VLLATLLTGSVWVLLITRNVEWVFLAGIPLGFAAEMTKTAAAAHPFRARGLDASRTLLLGLIVAGPLGAALAHNAASTWTWAAIVTLLASAAFSHHRFHCRVVPLQ